MFFNDFFNFVLICKDSKPRYIRTGTIGIFSTVRVVSFTTFLLSINFLKHLFIKLSRQPYFKKISFRQINPMCNLVQLEHIPKHLQLSVHQTYRQIVEMCINSSKGRFTADRSGKCFIFRNDLYIKKGDSISLFTFNYK